MKGKKILFVTLVAILSAAIFGCQPNILETAPIFPEAAKNALDQYIKSHDNSPYNISSAQQMTNTNPYEITNFRYDEGWCVVVDRSITIYGQIYTHFEVNRVGLSWRVDHNRYESDFLDKGCSNW